MPSAPSVADSAIGWWADRDCDAACAEVSIGPPFVDRAAGTTAPGGPGSGVRWSLAPFFAGQRVGVETPALLAEATEDDRVEAAPRQALAHGAYREWRRPVGREAVHAGRDG